MDSIRVLMAQVLRVQPDRITDSASPDTIPTWDSLTHLQLVAALEKRFGVRFNLREIQTMDTYANIAAVLRARCQNRESEGTAMENTPVEV